MNKEQNKMKKKIKHTECMPEELEIEKNMSKEVKK